MPNSARGLPNQQSFDTHSSGVVLDRVTGLTWQRALTGKLVTFADARRNCEELTLAGYDDWRLPSRIELASILDLTRTQPAIDVAVFPNTPSDWFWTSSAAAGDPQSAWYVYFYFGYPKTDLVSNQFSVRCVRGGTQKSALPAHYDVQTEIVRDLGTGLSWARAVSDQALGFDAARAYCSNLGLAGKAWRVPSMPELLTLIDERAVQPPLIDRSAFPNTPSEAFWSSSSFGGSAGMAWQVYFDQGHALYGLESVELRVRCVTALP
jgi:hypothetical protein